MSKTEGREVTKQMESTEPTEFNEDEFINELLADDEITENSNKSNEQPKEINVKTSKFPLAKIKSIMKLDPDVELASQESVFLIARATELFLRQLAIEVYTNTSKAKRKTMQKRDLDIAIENIDSLCFLEGALD